MAAAPSAPARPRTSIDFRAVDLGSVIAFDVDLCTTGPTRVRFEADFRQGKSTRSYRRWRGQRQGTECTRIFLGLHQNAERLRPGAWKARLKLRLVDLHAATTTGWQQLTVR